MASQPRKGPQEDQTSPKSQSSAQGQKVLTGDARGRSIPSLKTKGSLKMLMRAKRPEGSTGHLYYSNGKGEVKMRTFLKIVGGLLASAAFMFAQTKLPQLRFDIQPEYTKEARKAKLQGFVTLSFIVDAQGNPREIHVAHPLGKGLDDNAVEALKKWVWFPATKDGVPIESKAQVDVTFKLKNTSPVKEPKAAPPNTLPVAPSTAETSVTTASETGQPIRACVGQVCIDGITLDIGPHSCYVKGKLHNGSTTTFERVMLTFRLGRDGATTGTATDIMPVPLGPGESWSFSALSLDPASYTDAVTMELGHGAPKTAKFGPVWSPQADAEKRKWEAEHSLKE